MPITSPGRARTTKPLARALAAIAGAAFASGENCARLDLSDTSSKAAINPTPRASPTMELSESSLSRSRKWGATD